MTVRLVFYCSREQEVGVVHASPVCVPALLHAGVAGQSQVLSLTLPALARLGLGNIEVIMFFG